MSNSEIKQPEPLYLGHMLGFMFLTFAHFTDGDVTDSEMETIREKLSEWMADSDPTGINTLSETIDWYNSTGSARLDVLSYIAGRWREMSKWNDELITCILDDLVSIAKSDGRYDDEEKRWVNLIAKKLDIDYTA